MRLRLKLRFFAAAFACIVLLGSGSCTKKSPSIERVAIVPANLLLSDPGLEWLKVGVPLALQHDLRTAQSLIAGLAQDEASSAQSGATRVLRTSVENRNGGLHVECTLVDATTHKVLKVETAGAATASVLLPALDRLAQKFDTHAIAFPTKSSESWQAFAAAESNNNPQQRAQFLNQALRHDQNFGLAWVLLMEMIVPNRQNDLKRMVDEAKSHRNGFAIYDKAKFDVAINRISSASPADQVKAAKILTAVAPNDLEGLTILGFGQILQGDAAGGEQSLRQAMNINPANLSLRFQLARGLMQVRKFKDAETVFQTIDKTPAVYPEMATCLLLEGNKAQADTTFEKFAASVQNDELKPLLRAAWQVMSGNRQKGVDQILGNKFKTPNIQTIALSEAVVWQSMGGDFGTAAKTAGLLGQAAGQNIIVPKIAELLADKQSATADWEKKVQLAGLPAAIQEPLLGYGFFLHGNYAEAARVWQQVNDANHGADLHARVMLASSLEKAGKTPAPKIAILPFTPEFTDLYAAISFTEMRRLLKN